VVFCIFCIGDDNDDDDVFDDGGRTTRGDRPMHKTPQNMAANQLKCISYTFE